MIFCTRGNSGLKEGRDAKKAWWAHTKSLQTRQQGNCCLVVGRRHAHPPHTSGCQQGSGGLVIRWAHLPTSPHLITQSLSSYSWSLTRCPVGDGLLSSSLAGCGMVGGDVTTPAPTSLNEGRSEGDMGAAVLLLRSSNSAFGNDVALQLNGELQWRWWGSMERCCEGIASLTWWLSSTEVVMWRGGVTTWW